MGWNPSAVELTTAATNVLPAVECLAIAAAVQAGARSLHFVVPFDHNGLFHLAQMPVDVPPSAHDAPLSLCPPQIVNIVSA
jgi:hypothetical protein